MNYSNSKTNKWPLALKKIFSSCEQDILHRLVRHIDRLLIINNLLNELIPPEIRLHCQAIQCTVTELTLAADSAAWVTRLRYLQPKLLSSLRNHAQFCHLSQILFKIIPIQVLPAPLPAQPRTLSSENSRMLQTLAESISDLPLRQALLRLITPKSL